MVRTFAPGIKKIRMRNINNKDVLYILENLNCTVMLIIIWFGCVGVSNPIVVVVFFLGIKPNTYIPYIQPYNMTAVYLFVSSIRDRQKTTTATTAATAAAATAIYQSVRDPGSRRCIYVFVYSSTITYSGVSITFWPHNLVTFVRSPFATDFF
jgi:hypothetical protein